MGNYLKDKSIGFWVTLATALLLLLSGVLYLALVNGIDKYVDMAAKWNISQGFIIFVGVLPIIGSIASIALLALKQYSAIGYTQFGFGLVSFLGFALASSKYVFEVFMDIEIHAFAGSLIVLGVFFVLTLVLSVANVFFKQVKTAEEVAHE